MANFNPQIERKQIQWDVYSKVAQNGQIASGLLFVIAAVAAAAMYALNPQAFLLPANYPALVTLGAVGGFAFVSFAISTVVRCCAWRKNCKGLAHRLIKQGDAAPQVVVINPPSPPPAPEEADQSPVFVPVSDSVPASPVAPPLESAPVDSNDSSSSYATESSSLSSADDNDDDIGMFEDMAIASQDFSRDPLQVSPPSSSSSAASSSSSVDEASSSSEARPPVEPISVEELQKLIPGIMDEIENLLLAFNAAYYRADKSKSTKKVPEIKEGMRLLKDLVNRLVNDKRQLMLGSFLGAFGPLLNASPLLSYLDKTPQEFIYLIPSLFQANLADVDPDLKPIYGCVQEMANLMAARQDLAQDKQFLLLLKDLKQAYADYKKIEATVDSLKPQYDTQVSTLRKKYQEELTRLAAKKKLDESSKKDLLQKLDKDKAALEYSKQSEKKQEAGGKYFDARRALFGYLLDTTKIDQAVWERWATQIIPTYLERAKLRIFTDIVPDILNDLFTGHQKNGVFKENEGKILAATTASGPILLIVEQMLKKLPFGKIYKEGLYQAIKKLLPALSNPFYYATCTPMFSSTPHRFYVGVKALFEDKSMTPPQFEEEATWPEYLQTYIQYLQKFTKRLNEMTF